MVCMAFDEASVRPAVAADAAAIARVHVASTLATYRGIYPESWLGRVSVEGRTERWNRLLGAPEPGWAAFVGCKGDGSVVGFLCGGAERTGGLGCDGELYAIYLLPAVQRQGLGGLLVRRLAGELRSAGFTSMAVWVLARNPSKAFYEALGATAIGERELQRDGETLVEVAYGWRDWSRLLG